MTALVWVLIVIGMLFVLGSFFVTEKLSSSDIEKIKEVTENEVKMILQAELDKADDKIRENMDEKMAAALMKIAANPAKIAKLKGNLPSDAKANNEFFEQRLNLMIGQARMMLERQKLEAYIANKRDDARLYGTV